MPRDGEALLTVGVAVIHPLDGKRILEHPLGDVESDAVVCVILDRLGLVPIETIIAAHSY
jgi:hypothetical protein